MALSDNYEYEEPRLHAVAEHQHKVNDFVSFFGALNVNFDLFAKLESSTIVYNRTVISRVG